MRRTRRRNTTLWPIAPARTRNTTTSVEGSGTGDFFVRCLVGAPQLAGSGTPGTSLAAHCWIDIFVTDAASASCGRWQRPPTCQLRINAPRFGRHKAHVDLVVARVERLPRENAAGALGIDPVAAAAVGQRRQGSDRERLAGKAAFIVGIMPGVGVIRGDIDRVGLDKHRLREADRLPA